MPRKGKMTQTTYLLPDQLLDRLREMAETLTEIDGERISQAALLRRYIREGLAKDEAALGINSEEV